MLMLIRDGTMVAPPPPAERKFSVALDCIGYVRVAFLLAPLRVHVLE